MKVCQRVGTEGVSGVGSITVSEISPVINRIRKFNHCGCALVCDTLKSHRPPEAVRQFPDDVKSHAMAAGLRLAATTERVKRHVLVIFRHSDPRIPDGHALVRYRNGYAPLVGVGARIS